MHDGITIYPRIRLLIVIHLLVGIAPLAKFLFLETNWMFPWWAIDSLRTAQIMLLSFWVGMGGNKGITRVVGAFIGTAFVTFWPALTQNLSYPGSSFSQMFLNMYSTSGAMVLLFSSTFLLVRRRGTKLVHLSQFSGKFTPARVQYSTFHLLVLMSICSLVLSLVKVAQPADMLTSGSIPWIHVATILLMLAIFCLINNLCATWATLSLNSPWSRIAFVIGIAVLLGMAFGIGTGNYSLSWQMFIGVSLIPVLSTAIVIVSLLVIRSCHYRLVPSGLLQAAS